LAYSGRDHFRLAIFPVTFTGRTLESDLLPIIDLAQRTGVRIEAHTFVGSSPVRAHAEDWDDVGVV
jgi:2-isopropylmalate synthase